MDLEEELEGMTVHHNPNSIANMQSLNSVAEMHRLMYDSWDCGGVFMVHTPNGVVEFKPNARGLHYVDLSADEIVRHMLVMAGMTNHKDDGEEEEEESEDFEQVGNKDLENTEGLEDLEDTEGLNLKETEESKSNEYVLVTTVRGNSKGYTRHNIKKAQETRRLQGMIGNPIEGEFMGMAHEKLIASCPVTVQDVHYANLIFGPDLANLRGKTTRTKLKHVRVDYVKIPQDFIKMNKYVALVADVLFVKGLLFLVTSSRGISFIMIEFLPLWTAKRLALALKLVIRM
jgi:hypothetical protein